MLRTYLQCVQNIFQFTDVDTVLPDHFSNDWFSLGDRSCFIKNDRIHFMG